MLATDAFVLGSPAALRRVVRMASWLVNKLPELTGVAGIVVVLGFVWTNHGDVSALKTGQANLENRVDRIADQLSDIGVRIASETIRTPFQSVLITTVPFELVGGKWAREARLLDIAAGTASFYRLPLSGPKDLRTAWSISGSIHAVDARAIQMNKMIQLGSEAGFFDALPPTVSGHSSYVSYVGASILAKQFKELGLSPTTNIAATVSNTWRELLHDMSKQPLWVTAPVGGKVLRQ